MDYLSTKHEAKCAEEIPEEEREKNRMSFEEQLVQGGAPAHWFCESKTFALDV